MKSLYTAIVLWINASAHRRFHDSPIVRIPLATSPVNAFFDRFKLQAQLPEQLPPASRVSARYMPATLRCTTPVDSITKQLGVAFDLPDEQVVRLQLTVEHARQLQESLDIHLAAHASERLVLRGSDSPDGCKSMPMAEVIRQQMR